MQRRLEFEDRIVGVIDWMRSLDWRAMLQAAIPTLIAGLLLKLIGAA